MRIPVFYMLVTGQTQLSGKTTMLKALARQAVEKGYKVLVLDTKTQVEDYEGFGKQVPICLQQTTDSLVLMGLLESIFKRKITRYYSTLTQVAEDAQTFEDVIANAEALREKTRVGFIKGACGTLIDLLKRLLLETKKHETTVELKLPHKLNRMTINAFPVEGQQLIAKTVFEQALRKFKKIIIIIDEAFKFLPQKYSSACARAIQEYITQGGATECFMWMSTQFLAPTNKDAMKAMQIKLLGRQAHVTECEHTVALIPRAAKKFTKDSIMELKLGHFVAVSIDKPPRTVYAVPEYADKEECIDVALGLRQPKSIHYVIKVSPEFLKKMPKNAYSTAPKQTKPAQKRKKPEAKVEIPIEIEKQKEEEKPEKKTETKKPHRRPSQVFIPPSARRGVNERFELFANNLEALRQKQKTIEERLANLESVESPKIVHTETIPEFQHNVERPVVTTNEKSMVGRVITLASKGFFKEKQKISEISKEITRVFAVSVNLTDVNKALGKAVQLKVLEREKTSAKAWVYWLVEGAKERIMDVDS